MTGIASTMTTMKAMAYSNIGWVSFLKLNINSPSPPFGDGFADGLNRFIGSPYYLLLSLARRFRGALIRSSMFLGQPVALFYENFTVSENSKDF